MNSAHGAYFFVMQVVPETMEADLASETRGEER